MSRFATNPKWLIYLPPTMSPCETSGLKDYLEYPTEAFSYYRSVGVPRVICQEKHMGSRAIVIVCKSEEAARNRFGVAGNEIGVVYTRTGRQFFEDKDLERELLDVVRSAMEENGFWDLLSTDWACLDSELMPWSAKAQQLLREQYAAVGAAATASLQEALSCLTQAAGRSDLLQGFDVPTHSSSSPANLMSVLEGYRSRAKMIKGYVTAYRQYCWPVKGLEDLKLAPFHLLATEGCVHTDKNHAWHMDTLERLCRAGEAVLLKTSSRMVNLADPSSEAEATEWWTGLTGKGGEGMVVKPLDFVTAGRRGLVQPAVKVRGRDYLRIIYGPQYTAPHNMERLRKRSLGRKRSLALREFALGIDALERFVRHEPLRRVHECVFGVLALESEPVDPRL